MTDYKKLCVELLSALESWSPGGGGPLESQEAEKEARLIERARAALADEPAAPAPPADGEVAELVADLQECADSCILSSKPYWAEPMRRAAELLEQQAPVAVSERPWEREEWCDTDGLCWLGSHALDGCTPTWLYGTPAWAERFPNFHRVLLPAHALPLPEVGE